MILDHDVWVDGTMQREVPAGTVGAILLGKRGDRITEHQASVIRFLSYDEKTSSVNHSSVMTQAMVSPIEHRMMTPDGDKRTGKRGRPRITTTSAPSPYDSNHSVE